MICYAKEISDAEEMNVLNALDIHSILYPKSQGVMAMESMMYGTTSISTESVFSKIKDRAYKLLEKAKSVLAKFGSFLKENKWWFVSGLAVVSAFAATAFTIHKRSQDKASKSSGNKDISSINKATSMQLTELYKEAKVKIQVAKKKKAKEAKVGERMRKSAERNNEVTDTRGAKNILGKIYSYIKSLFGMMKSNSSDVNTVVSKAQSHPGNESFVSQAVWFSKHPIYSAAFGFLTMGVGFSYISMVRCRALTELCVAHVNSEKQKKDSE